MMRITKKIIITFCVTLISGYINVVAQERTWTLDEINIRDPFILPVKKEKTYYLYRTVTEKNANGKETGGVEAFCSTDLKIWHGPYKVLTVHQENWATGAIWAPEVHKYKGKYYLFATLTQNAKWKKSDAGWFDQIYRGTQVFYSDSPLGPFKPFSNFPHTPLDQMSLDGTLYVENGIPYMIYCHEWIQLGDGAINIARMKKNLSSFDSEPFRLFHSSSAPWSTGLDFGESNPKGYVTDGCFIYKSKDEKLLMIWSSFHNGQYAIGIAESVTGSILGPWIQQENPLFENDGGHGMLFKSFDGKLFLVLHSPNGPGGAERAKLFEIEDKGNTLTLKYK